MVSLLGLTLTPLVIGGIFVAIYRKTITIKELLVMELVVLLVLGVGFFAARWDDLQDVQHVSGRISEKTVEPQDCCHCRSDCSRCSSSQRDRGECSCVMRCNHDRDFQFVLTLDTGDKLVVEECRGSSSHGPQVFDDAYVGQPASVARTYTNYLKADRMSLHHTGSGDADVEDVPDFPELYDVYKVDKVVGVGLAVPRGWQEAISEVNADLGAEKEVDVTVVLTSRDNREFTRAVDTAWAHGPKNAVIVVLGAPDGKTVSWAGLVTISNVETLRVRIREGVVGLKIDEPKVVAKVIRDAVQADFQRTPMAEFKYLSWSTAPSTGWLVGLYGAAILLTCALGFFMHWYDIFGDEKSSSGSRFS